MGTTRAITGKQRYKTTIQTSVHEIIADEPIQLGGRNQGPNPTELLAASLASCTSITLRMYADRKEWEVGEIVVNVNLNIEDKDNAIIMRDIEISGQLNEEQLIRLLTIANACPVHKLLNKGIEINTQLSLNND